MRQEQTLEKATPKSEMFPVPSRLPGDEYQQDSSGTILMSHHIYTHIQVDI